MDWTFIDKYCTPVGYVIQSTKFAVSVQTVHSVSVYRTIRHHWMHPIGQPKGTRNQPEQRQPRLATAIEILVVIRVYRGGVWCCYIKDGHAKGFWIVSLLREGGTFVPSN